MVALTQFSYTSAKNMRTASSVAGLVGLAPMAVDERLDAAAASPEREEAVPPGAVGWWRRRNFALAAVTKQDT